MNKRIAELYQQTSEGTADGKEWAIGGLQNASRFAELIVQECARTAFNGDPEDGNRLKIGREILKLFDLS